MNISRSSIYLGSIALSCFACAATAQFSLSILPQPEQGSAIGIHLSPDGSAISGVLESATDHARAFRWTLADGYRDLGTLEAGWASSWTAGLSQGGGAVVGGALRPDYSVDPFVWTQGAGMRRLATPTNLSDCSAGGITPDARRIVGSAAINGENTIVRWVDGVFENLGKPADRRAVARDVSSDGNVIATEERWDAHLQIGRWTAEHGFESLGGLTPEGASEFGGISGDGRVIVGWAAVAAHEYRAFRWTADTGMENLGILPGDAGWSAASAVSSDGSLIAGTSGWTVDERAFLWSAASGMVDLRQYLRAHGVTNAADWKLLSVREMSDDGLTLMGTAQDTLGEQFTFLATIPAPAPLGLGMLAFCRRRRLP